MSVMWWLLAALVLLWGLSWLGKRWLPDAKAEEPRGSPADPPGALADDTPEGLEYDVRIGDELDLHGVKPGDVAQLVDAFVDDAYERGRVSIRIIHGKGIGALRAQVRARLARHPHVRAFGDAPPPGSWGATVVELNAPSHDVEADHATD